MKRDILRTIKKLCFFGLTFLFFTNLAFAQQPTEIPENWKSISGCGVLLSVPANVLFIKDDSVDTCERFYGDKNTTFHITATEGNVGPSDYSEWPEYCVTKLVIG